MTLEPEANPTQTRDKLDWNDYSKESQRKRGQGNKGKPKGFVLRKERNCNTRCPMFTMCRFQILGKFLPEDLKGKCALANAMSLPEDKQISERQQYRVVKFIYGGQSDQIELMREVASNIDLIADKKSVKEL